MNSEVAAQLTTVQAMKERLFSIMINGNMGAGTFNEEEVTEMLEDTMELLDRYPEDEQIKRMAVNMASGYYVLKNTAHYPFRLNDDVS
jgi:hypothetical protein